MRRLAIRPGGIGDCILSFPSLQHLAKDASLEVWTRAEVLPLIDFATSHSIDSTGLGLLGIEAPQPRLIERLKQFDEICTWYGTARVDFREAINAIHTNVKFFNALPEDSTLHAADYFAGQVGAPTPAIPAVSTRPIHNRLIYIHPFSGSAKKNWLLENFQLLSRWLETTGRAVQFIVAPHQHLPGAKVVDNLYELANLLSGSSLYIGNDSGITHLAAACGANTLAIFGPTDPAIWAPRGPGVTILHNVSLDRISVEQVLDSALFKTGFQQ